MSDFDPAEHTIDEVHSHLAEHPEDTERVLNAERDRGDEARSTLVSSLERDATTEESAEPRKRPGQGDDEGDEGEAPAKPEDASIFPPGEYPDSGIFGYITEEAEPK